MGHCPTGGGLELIQRRGECLKIGDVVATSVCCGIKLKEYLIEAINEVDCEKGPVAGRMQSFSET